MIGHKKRRARRAAFTLIEVLLVLAILVIVGSMAVFSLSNVSKSAYEKSAKVQIDAFKGMLKLYRLDVGSYPTTNQGLQALWVQPGDLKNPQKWRGPYAEEKEIPPDPWGNPYQYELIGPEQVHIYSWGADGMPGTQDDVSNS